MKGCQRVREHAFSLSVSLSLSLCLPRRLEALEGEERELRGGEVGGQEGSLGEGGSPAGLLNEWSGGKKSTSGVILAVVVHNSSCFTPRAGSHRGGPLEHQQHCSSSDSSCLYIVFFVCACSLLFLNATKIEDNAKC